jgi:hypothetical protein
VTIPGYLEAATWSPEKAAVFTNVSLRINQCSQFILLMKCNQNMRSLVLNLYYKENPTNEWKAYCIKNPDPKKKTVANEKRPPQRILDEVFKFVSGAVSGYRPQNSAAYDASSLYITVGSSTNIVRAAIYDPNDNQQLKFDKLDADALSGIANTLFGATLSDGSSTTSQ